MVAFTTLNLSPRAPKRGIEAAKSEKNNNDKISFFRIAAKRKVKETIYIYKVTEGPRDPFNKAPSLHSQPRPRVKRTFTAPFSEKSDEATALAADHGRRPKWPPKRSWVP